MESRFDQETAERFVAERAAIPRELALRVYTSRLIGADPGLVLHGGGNTSVKITSRNLFGEPVELLCVKGSGWDLATIEAPGFPAIDLGWARRLRALDALDDEAMVNQLRTHLVDASSPDPSIEALLHAFLPHRFVDHTHADAVLVLTNQPGGESLVREAMGNGIAFLPYIMPGFPLARAVADLYERDPSVEAIVLGHHGIFTFGDDARTSYERMITHVDRAERFIAARRAPRAPGGPAAPRPLDARTAARRLQALRGALAFTDGAGRRRRFVLEVRGGHDLVAAAAPGSAERLAAPGVLTPDHILRTRNEYVPLTGLPEDDAELVRVVRESIDRARDRYRDYFDTQVRAKSVQRTMLDTTPRVFLVEGVGVVAAGFTRKAARIAADIAEHTVRAKLDALAIGRYTPLGEGDLFDMEYWSLEQKKLGKGAPLPLEGEVALVTGGAGAIALGVADRLLAAGAVVALTDIDAGRLESSRARLAPLHGGDRVITLPADVTDEGAVRALFDRLTALAGGVDIVVPNAGIAHVAPLESLAMEDLRRVLDVNFLGVFTVLKAAADAFRRQASGGAVILVSTKNVFEPGASFGAYSASKAAAHQLARIAALEFAPLGVAVNMVNPDAVFGDEETPSGLWEMVGPERARSRGMSPDELRRYYVERNLLKREVTARHVGNAVVFFATEATPTTGASLPVDGGLPGAFPR